MSEKEKPPIGVMPEMIWRETRAFELMEAIIRFRDAGYISPAEWWHELTEHLVMSQSGARQDYQDLIRRARSHYTAMDKVFDHETEKQEDSSS